MKLKMSLLVMSLGVTLLLLFGGYAVYTDLWVKKPMLFALQTDPMVTVKKLDIQPKRVYLELIPQKGFSLRRDFPRIHQKIQSIAKNRDVTIHLQDHPNQALHNAWYEMSFGLREGIAWKRYTQLKDTVVQVSEKHRLQAEVLLYEETLIVGLRQKEYVLYRMLPLQEVRKDDGSFIDRV